MMPFAPRLLGEALERHIAGTVIKHHAVPNRRRLNLGPGEFHLHGLGHTNPAKRYDDWRTHRAEQLVLDLLRVEATRIGRVDDHDLVAFLHATALGGGVREDLIDGHVIADLRDLHADAGIAPVGVARELFELLGREELGVGIVEFLHQAARRLLIELLRVERVHVPQGDERQHLVEELSPATRGPRLQGKAPGEHGEENQTGQGGLTGSCHAAALKGGTGKNSLEYVRLPTAAVPGRGDQVSSRGREPRT